MASPISNLIPQILQHLPSGTEIAIAQKLKEVVIDFFKRSHIYAVDLAAINVVADTAEYALTNPSGFQIKHIKSGSIESAILRITSEDQLDLDWETLSKQFGFTYDPSSLSATTNPLQTWRVAVSDTPPFVYQPNPNMARLVGIPSRSITGGLLLKVVCYPTLAVTTIDDWIYNAYWETLRSGVVGMLKMMPEKPYTDLRTAQAFLDAYEDGVQEAASHSMRSFQRNDRPHLRCTTYR